MILSFFSVKIIPGSYIMHEFNLCYSRIFITQSYYIFNAAFSPDAVVPLSAFHFLDHLKPCEILALFLLQILLDLFGKLLEFRDGDVL